MNAGDRERFEEIHAHYDKYGFDGPAELDAACCRHHERNGIIGFLLNFADQLTVENAHLRDSLRDAEADRG